MPVVIRFDPGKLQSCRRAILQLCAVIEDHHSPTVLRHLVVGAIPLDGRDLQLANNDRLLVKYMRSGLSIRKCAAMLAEKNKSLPPDLRLWSNWHHQCGDAGKANPSFEEAQELSAP